MRPAKENAHGKGGTGQGIHKQAQQGDADFAVLGTQEANEIRIRELRAAMDATAAAGDLVTYKQHQAEYIQAMAGRSPEQIHHLNELHLTTVERAVALGDHGLRFVPAAWLETDAGRAVAWRTSRPMADEAEALKVA